MSRLSTPRLIVATVISLLIVGLFAFRVHEAERSASRTIGIYLDDTAPLELTELVPGGPAERAGLEVGDRFIAAEGIEIRKIEDFDRIAEKFSPGKPIFFEIVRDGQEQTIPLTPGVPLEIWYFPLDGFVLLASLLLFILVWSRPTLEIRSNLLSAMFVLIALSMAIPFETIQTSLEGFTWAGYFLIDALEMAVTIHLISLIPRRPRWLLAYPSLIPLSYLLFGVLGLSAAATTIASTFYGVAEFPWPLSHAIEIQWHAGALPWCGALILILGAGIRAARNRIERLQAQLVLVGLLPLIVLIMGMWIMSLAQIPIPEKFDQISGLFMLPFLISIGLAMFRYELIDMELVIERGLLYSTMTSGLFLIFYASLGIGGAVATDFFGDSHPDLDRFDHCSPAGIDDPASEAFAPGSDRSQDLSGTKPAASQAHETCCRASGVRIRLGDGRAAREVIATDPGYLRRHPVSRGSRDWTRRLGSFGA